MRSTAVWNVVGCKPAEAGSSCRGTPVKTLQDYTTTRLAAKTSKPKVNARIKISKYKTKKAKHTDRNRLPKLFRAYKPRISRN
jgi:hypothetical protein